MGNAPPGRSPGEPEGAPDAADAADAAAPPVLPDGAPPDDRPAAPPADAEGWRALFAALPARDLLRAIQKDKGRAARLLAGFRADGASIRHPVVVARLVEAAQKQPAFARDVLEEAPPLPPVPLPSEGKGVLPSKVRVISSAPLLRPAGASADPTATVGTPVPNAPSPSEGRGTGGRGDDEPLKAKLKEHRAALREKDERLRGLEAALAAAERQRDAALGDVEAARAARAAAEADAERERRRREREERRHGQQDGAAAVSAAAAAAPSPARSAGAGPAPAAPPPAAPAPIRPALFEDAMERLLSRGRHAAVADVCREALTLLEDAAARAAYGRHAEGVVRRLYAEALAAAPDARHRQMGDEQERLALAAFLEAGDAGGAAESWARLTARRLAAGAPAALKGNDAAQLARMAALTERTGQSGAVREAFERARAGAPEVTEQLRALLADGGRKFAPLLAALPPPPAADARVGPDEAIALPTLPAVTPRGVARAVEGGDAGYVRQVRAGLRALRGRGDAALADAVEAAVAGLNPLAALPLLRKGEPRPIVVDASNVARSDPDPLALARRPHVASLRQMRDFLLRRGWFPVVLIADANLRYHVDDRAAYLALVEAGVVRETPPGSVADAFLIREAEDLGAPLVTNDRLADWGDAAGGIERYGFVLFPGGAALLPS